MLLIVPFFLFKPQSLTRCFSVRMIVSQQHKEALKHVQAAIVLYRGHYGAESKEPDLLELYKMEEVLKSTIKEYY